MVLDPNTDAGHLDALNREFCAALGELLAGLATYVDKFHPDGLMWRWDKTLSKAEAVALSPKEDQKKTSKLLGKFKAAGTAALATKKFGAFGVQLKPVEKPEWSTEGEEDIKVAGLKRLGSAFFRQALPEEIVAQLEAEGAQELKALQWPSTDTELRFRPHGRRASAQMDQSKLLEKVASPSSSRRRAP